MVRIGINLVNSFYATLLHLAKTREIDSTFFQKNLKICKFVCYILIYLFQFMIFIAVVAIVIMFYLFISVLNLVYVLLMKNILSILYG